MLIQLRFFASLREALKVSQETVELPAHVQTLGALRSYLIARGEPWASALALSRPVRMALNQHMAQHDTPLQANAEVAFFPPVTGG